MQLKINAEDKVRIKGFKKAVNMTLKRLEAWLEMGESKEVDHKESDGNESVGHQSAKCIIKLFRMNEL